MARRPSTPRPLRRPRRYGADVARAAQVLWKATGPLHLIRGRLPMRLRGLDTDNGSEFINRPRSRPYRKTDSAHVEQKNGAIVRALVGYDRYASRAAYAQLARVYQLLRLHTNFFQPVQRPVAKRRQGARVTRWHDRAPNFQRLLAARGLSPGRERQLTTLYETLNPLHLRREIDAALATLWRLAPREPAPPSPLGSSIAPGNPDL